MYITGNKNKKKQNYLFKIYWHLYYVLSIYCSAAYGNNFYLKKKNIHLTELYSKTTCNVKPCLLYNLQLSNYF